MNNTMADSAKKNLDKQYTFIQEMAAPPYNFDNYIYRNVRYPNKARKKNIQGRVIVQFTVNEDGHISDVKVTQSVDPLIDSEAVRVIRSMPPWIPGSQEGKKVKVLFKKAINFSLAASDGPGSVNAVPKFVVNTYVSNHIKYPDAAAKDHIRGLVGVNFLIDSIGNISDCKVTKSLGYGCDEEALALVGHMPAWIPKMINDTAVSSRYNLDIYFSPDGDQLEYSPAHLPAAKYDIGKFITDNIIMPEKVKNGELAGNVYVRFVVNKDGTLSDFYVSGSLDNECDKEALRLARSMPSWEPGTSKSGPVNVSMQITVSFHKLL